MISKHVACEPGNDDYGRLARYIADADHKGEKCLAHWCAGCGDNEDYDFSILEAEATQALNTLTTKAKTYHLIVSFRPEDETRLTPDTFREIERAFATALGFADHQRHCGVHRNTANLHLHVAYNQIHPERLTRHDPFRDYKTLSDTCRRLEREYGLAVDNGMEQIREGRLSVKAAALEAHSGQESFATYAQRHREDILNKLERARTWRDVHNALARYGMSIQPHGNGLAIKDKHGRHAVKASSVDRSLSMKKLEARFGPFAPLKIFEAIQERDHYEAAPLHRGPERGRLYAEYRQGIEERKARLQAVKEREDTALAGIKAKWAAKRAEIEAMSIAKKNRRNLLALARKHEAEALAKARMEYAPEREAVRRDVPFTSWNGFLRLEAEKGNETALAVLRSRNESIEPERETNVSSNLAQPAFARAVAARKERAALERTDLSSKGRKQLLAFARMDRLVAEARAQGNDIGEIRQHIDNKGVVIFTLPSGGSIRDTGREVFYSVHDEKAMELAARYAALKWGRNVGVKPGRMVFAKGREEQRERKQERGAGL